MRPDPAAMGSQFARIENDAYHTIEAPMAIGALLDSISIRGRVLEPAAGRGHLVREMRKYGLDVAAFDLIKHADPIVDDITTNCDLMTIRYLNAYDALVTNLPYKLQDKMLQRILPVANRDGCLVATLARASWCLPQSKRHLFLDHPYAAAIVHLPRRPYWFPRLADQQGPRHEYAWFVWGTEPRTGSIVTLAPKESTNAVRP